MIVGLHHVAVSVSDLVGALVLYRDLLGFEVVQESSWDRDFPAADRAIGLAATAARMAMLKAHKTVILDCNLRDCVVLISLRRHK